MPLKQNQESILDLYQTQEVRMAELYTAFARRFSMDREFWQRMAREERLHARIVSSLKTAAAKGVLLFDPGRVDTHDIAAMTARIETLMHQGAQEVMDRVMALSHAMEIESSLVESGVFTQFKALTDKAREVLRRLNNESLDHAAWVRRVLDSDTTFPDAPLQAGGHLIWTESLSVNDSRLDDQHRLLFALINDLADLRLSGAPRETLLKVVQRMIAFSDAHFGSEDDVMIASDFPRFDAHRLEHQLFLGQIRRFLNDYSAGREQLSDEILAFLKRWWFHHTAQSDRQYALWILEHGRQA
jgi:hemerythrin-like metal-binding protein